VEDSGGYGRYMEDLSPYPPDFNYLKYKAKIVLSGRLEDIFSETSLVNYKIFLFTINI